MIIEKIVLQSAGSLSVAVLALMMAFLQAVFFFRKRRFMWYGWSAAISFSGMIYAVGIFLEYNTLGSINRFAGLLEFTAIILLVHCLYGFTFAYLEIHTKVYHLLAGIFHCLVLVFLWSNDYIVADRLVSRDFILMAEPFIESDLGPLGPLFEVYAALSCFVAVLLWLFYRGPDKRHRTPYLVGMTFWIVLGVHDGLASTGIRTLQYFMEYGFVGFSIALLWVVFDSFVDISGEDKYRVITEFANDGILVIQDRKTVFANPACNSLIGRPVKDTPAEDFLDVLVPEDRQKLMDYYGALLNSIDSHDTLIVHIKRSEDEERILEVRGNVINYRDKPAILSIIRDITNKMREEEALKESEEKLLRLKKMESLGLLAGGVAHDLNNVLSGIVGYPELIMLDLSEDSKLRKPIETMKESGERAVAIVQDLLTVARGVAVPKEPLNLNDIINGYFKTPEYKRLIQYHPSVTVKSDLSSDLLNVKGSSVHIGKVVMNLLSNACESIEGLGNVVISTENRYLDRPLKGYDDIKTGEYVVLRVKDTGQGISPDNLKQIFEPFFTKKVMGRSGTGLGLTLVWNVLQDHDGYIDVSSGRYGTKFDLYFPATRDSISRGKLSVPIEEIYGRGEMILIIDDIESQREILCHMMETLKYKTDAVSSGEEAIAYLKEHKADLLLLDMIMDPGMNGRDTYEKIKEINPGQKAIIVSGFAETDHVRDTLKMGAGRYLKKPVTLEKLGLAVREELER